MDEEEGVVEFVARYKIAGKMHRPRETSRFVRYEGRWVYLDGEPMTGEDIESSICRTK